MAVVWVWRQGRILGYDGTVGGGGYLNSKTFCPVYFPDPDFLDHYTLNSLINICLGSLQMLDLLTEEDIHPWFFSCGSVSIQRNELQDKEYRYRFKVR